MASNTPPFAVVAWELVDDVPMDERLVEVVSSKYLLKSSGFVLMSHNNKTYKGKLDSYHSSSTKAGNRRDNLNGEILIEQDKKKRPQRNKKRRISSSDEDEEENNKEDSPLTDEPDEEVPQEERRDPNMEQSAIQKEAHEVLTKRRYMSSSPKQHRSGYSSRNADYLTVASQSLPVSPTYGSSMLPTGSCNSNYASHDAGFSTVASPSLPVSPTYGSPFLPTGSYNAKSKYVSRDAGSSTVASQSFPVSPTDSPMLPTGSYNYVSRAEMYQELKNYVKKEELKSKIDRLKRKLADGCKDTEPDAYDEIIKHYPESATYDATKRLLEHVYTEDEILSHTVSGKRANSKVETVKPRFTPTRYSRVKSTLQKKFPSMLNDSTLITKKITAVQKRLKLDKEKRQSDSSLNSTN